MVEDRQARAFDAIINVVQDQLESGGYDAINLQAVAKRARVSLSTIYKFFPTRADLIVAALSQWMEEHTYADLADVDADAPLYDVQMSIFRRLFEPWERAPMMLKAYHRARTGEGGVRLDMQGIVAMAPIAEAAFSKVDAAYADDVRLILGNVIYAVIGRFADGDLSIAEILPVLERTMWLLTADNAALARRRDV